jgi:ATP-dependent RNA helicase SUPV3L1/SUV3
VLVASDAVGLGLNLNIRRVIFHATEKFDGKVDRTLAPAEIKQVRGRDWVWLGFVCLFCLFVCLFV